METPKMEYSEYDLYKPAMLALAAAPDGKLSTSDLIAGLEATLKPTGKDAMLLEGRNDTHFSQKVRNIKSHKKTPGNIVCDGLVDSVYRGFRLTDAGFKYLQSMGHAVHRL
jgi:hypothetical protein